MSKREKDEITNGEGSSDRPIWFENINAIVGGLNYYPHCKLGDGLVPHVMSSDAGGVMVYPIDCDTDIAEAAFNLEKAKEMLAREEPNAEVEMVFLMAPDVAVEKFPYEKRNIHCFDEQQLTGFAKNFFSKSRERIRLGKGGFRLGMYDSAFNLLTNVDVEDDADAQFMIGQMYAKGKGVKKDKKKAEEWYWKAANKGHADAALELEKGINREKAYLKRKEQELIDEIEAFAKKLLEED